MKSLIIFIIMFIPFQINSQWFTVNPIPDPVPNQNYTTVHFIDSLNGWAAGNHGVIVHTTNGGSDWVRQETGITSVIRKIRFANRENGWAVGDSGKIIHTTNGGENWVLQNSTANLNLNMLSVIDADYAFAAGKWGTTDQYVLLYTTSGGASWGTLSFRLDFTNEHVSEMVYINRNKGWYCTWQYVSPFTGGAIYHTNDGGKSWSRQKAFASFQSSISFTDDNHGWCIGDWGIFATTNGGTSWSGRGDLSNHWFSKVYFVDNNLGWNIEHIDFFGGFRASAINFTSNGGYSWFYQDRTPTNNVVYDITFIDKRIGWIAVANDIGGNGYLLNTSNGGGVFPSPPEVIYPSNNQVISSDTVNLIWNSETDILNYELNISEDSTFQNYIDTLITDTSFTLVNLEPNKNYYWRVRALNNIGWGGYSSIGRFNTFVTDVEYYSDNLVDFFLSQNYPNPFNPVTTIQYALKSRKLVTLKVYDMLGNELATLINEEKHPGVYEIEFNPTSDIMNLASGIYYYQLKAGSFVETKKMIYLK